MTGGRVAGSGPVLGLGLGLALGMALSGCVALQPSASLPALDASSQRNAGYLRFLGETALPSDLTFEGTPVGGLSAITWDGRAERYYAIADDPSYYADARFYELAINLDDGRLENGDLEVVGVTRLTDRNSRDFEKYVFDGEGVAISAAGTLYASSEGNVERGIEPRVSEFELSGREIHAFDLPRRYLPGRGGTRGVRHNLAFEGLSVTTDGRWLFSGIENALVQDGPEASLDKRSPARLIKFDTLSRRVAGEYLYWVEPVPEPPAQADGFRVNGLVEILALDEDRLLVLERAYAAGSGNTIRLFSVDLSAADDVRRSRLSGTRAARVTAARKTLLLDFDDLGSPLDNIEGMTFGPDLEDGSRTLTLIADNNFSPRQRSQVLAFAWSDAAVSISEIQGAGHRSPLAGAWVRGVEGVVTAVDREARQPLAWIQSGLPTDDDGRSAALAISPRQPLDIDTGDRVRVSGRVAESGRDGSLLVTRIEEAETRIIARDQALPEPITLGTNIPGIVDNDGLASFQPTEDALDFYESLEGMRVRIPQPIVVGPTSRFGDFVVLANEGEGLGPRTRRGGILLQPEDPNPERLQVDPRLVLDDEHLDLAVGDRPEAPIVGVLDYSFGAFEVLATEPLNGIAPAQSLSSRPQHVTDLLTLTVATFNVENLDALDSEEKYRAVAATVAEGLGSPDIVALQEIQDDDGSTDEGVVAAGQTLGRLTATIESLGGARYETHQLDPENNADGGQPGANIRVAYLVRPDRVDVPLRPNETQDPVRPELRSDGRLGLSHNPGRLATNDPAFALDENRAYQPTRKPLALEVSFADNTLFLVNLHLKSKRGDDGIFGPVQPPVRHSEKQRTEQARTVHQFVSSILAESPEAAIIVLGDLNEHEFRPPLEELVGSDLVNLVQQIDPPDRYTYNYRGNSQVLDHVLISRSLAEAAAAEVDIIHVNADSPTSARSSDHDPVLVRLRFSPR